MSGEKPDVHNVPPDDSGGNPKISQNINTNNDNHQPSIFNHPDDDINTMTDINNYIEPYLSSLYKFSKFSIKAISKIFKFSIQKTEFRSIFRKKWLFGLKILQILQKFPNFLRIFEIFSENLLSYQKILSKNSILGCFSLY